MTPSGRLREALAIREAYQGEAHPDLIWTLSLWIYALGWKHRPESALEAALLGERRLALRRAALAGAPDELAHSLQELIDTSIPSNTRCLTRAGWTSFGASWPRSQRRVAAGRRRKAWQASF